METLKSTHEGEMSINDPLNMSPNVDESREEISSFAATNQTINQSLSSSSPTSSIVPNSEGLRDNLSSQDQSLFESQESLLYQQQGTPDARRETSAGGEGSSTSFGLNNFQEDGSTSASPLPRSPSSMSGGFEVVTNSRDAIMIDSFNFIPQSHTQTSQASTTASPSISTKYKLRSSSSSRSCSTRSLQDAMHDKAIEYSGMPKVDDDIEVGKKITRRRKLSTQCPPSSNHVDVQPPPLNLVQQALRHHKTAGARRFKRPQPRAVATEFHDEKGHMFLYGSEEGKYVGDVLGGLPHGNGQHWIPKRCPPCGGPTGEIHMLYEGAWEYGSKHGFGRMMYTNGQVYSLN